MRSSIFSSRTPTKGHISLLLGLLAVFCVSVEAITAHYFGRISRIEHRRESEYLTAMKMQPALDRGHVAMLVAGNSLLLEGVDFPQLQEHIGQGIELRRTVFENTSFLDWYYGLRKLFRAGARPDSVVLVMSPSQLTSDATNGDYSVQMLVDHRDLLQFSKDIRADRNKISVLALDNFSYFFGTRAEIRSWILGKILPDLQTLTRIFRPRANGPEESSIQQVAAERIGQLRDLCSNYGVGLILVIPPANEDGGATQVLQAAASAGVPASEPISPGLLLASDFADAIHLNSQGSAKFTPALAESLKQIVRERTGNHSQTAIATPARTTVGVFANGVPTYEHFQQ